VALRIDRRWVPAPKPPLGTAATNEHHLQSACSVPWKNEIEEDQTVESKEKAKKQKY
jgi:hypothetical protein